MKIITLSLCILCTLSSAHALDNPTILYVGDSHSYGKLGTVIEKNLSTISPKVVMHASCGATPSTWLGNLKYEKTVCGYWFKEGTTEERLKEHQTPKFGDELAKYRPDVTIIQLGTNIAAGETPENSAASIKTMMAKVSAEGSQCIWIGPPDANSKVVTRQKLQKTNDLLIKLSKENNCQYVDSLKLTVFPEKNSEGIHYPPTLSAAWGDEVSLQLKTIIQAFK
ncbi:MAG: SGNH/GDSL hydrolase family protein [Bdellovibrionales bacterium]|nr:SGNH/GDSL hydrolase family protein [Bdellovibrionales bacterium]